MGRSDDDNTLTLLCLYVYLEWLQRWSLSGEPRIRLLHRRRRLRLLARPAPIPCLRHRLLGIEPSGGLMRIC